MTFVLFVHRHQRKTDMDPYERLTAINESLMGKIKGFFKRKPKEVRQFEKAVADLDKKYPDLPENQPTKANK